MALPSLVAGEGFFGLQIDQFVNSVMVNAKRIHNISILGTKGFLS